MKKEDILLEPEKFNSGDYLQVISQYNKKILRDVQGLIYEKMPFLLDSNAHYAIVTTGSDGRNEKSILSPMELILLH